MLQSTTQMAAVQPIKESLLPLSFRGFSIILAS
jgi:hypothetical protein